MICVIALIVFGILGIFSVKYRPVAKEALDCVFKRVTLRKCTTGLDKRLKSTITGKLMKKSPRIASFLYKYFEVISWLFLLLFLLSIVQTGISVYNVIEYGNCNGKTNGEGFCVFDPAGNGAFSTVNTAYEGKIIKPTVDDDPSIGKPDAPVTIIEFGCYLCPYTKRAEPVIQELLEAYPDDIYFVFRDFPLHENHVGANIQAESANCALEQGLFSEFRTLLFANQDNPLVYTQPEKETIALFAQLGKGNVTQFAECVSSRKYDEEVHKDFEDGILAGVYGTPTFFINDEVLVGPHTFEDFKKIVEKELKK